MITYIGMYDRTRGEERSFYDRMQGERKLHDHLNGEVWSYEKIKETLRSHKES